MGRLGNEAGVQQGVAWVAVWLDPGGIYYAEKESLAWDRREGRDSGGGSNFAALPHPSRRPTYFHPWVLVMSPPCRKHI